MDYIHPTIGQALLISVVGFATVFIVLIVLMLMIKLMSAVVKAVTPAPAAPAPVAPVAPTTAAPQTPVGVTLDGVEEKDAAVIMAIVADKLGKDPSGLQFISIKEVKNK